MQRAEEGTCYHSASLYGGRVSVSWLDCALVWWQGIPFLAGLSSTGFSHGEFRLYWFSPCCFPEYHIKTLNDKKKS